MLSRTTGSQFTEVRDTLGLHFVRILYAWTDAVQPTPNAPLDFGFFDQITQGLPDGVDALVVIASAPSWMSNSANWINGNPRATFVEKVVRPLALRYANNSRIIGYQIWNEPNNSSSPENATLQVLRDPSSYVEMLALGYNAVKAASPQKLVLNAATTAINQAFPDTLDYNRGMRDAGALSFVDRWAVHYYGKTVRKRSAGQWCG